MSRPSTGWGGGVGASGRCPPFKDTWCGLGELPAFGLLAPVMMSARWTMNALADTSFELRKQPMAVVWIRLETDGNVEVTSKIPWLCGRRFATPTVTTGTRWAITIDSGHDR